MLAEATLALLEANIAFAKAHPAKVPDVNRCTPSTEARNFFRPTPLKSSAQFALRTMDQYADDAAALGAALGIHDHPELETIYLRVPNKLETEPIEDFRIDFEDGYGNRSDAEEDDIGYLGTGNLPGQLPINQSESEPTTSRIRSLSSLFGSTSRETVAMNCAFGCAISTSVSVTRSSDHVLGCASTFLKLDDGCLLRRLGQPEFSAQRCRFWEPTMWATDRR